MNTISDLFDSAKDINRPIEKVINYSADQEDRLRNEISEYVVTKSIDHSLNDLLEKMQMAMRDGDTHEVGVWVSGFYGSGKSSLTKYLGFALDDRYQVDERRFLEHLQDRLLNKTTKAILRSVAKDFPAAVVMLDLASEMLAGATMAEISTVLYYKVQQWAGFSENAKLAALEMRLDQDGKYDAFKERASELLGGITWEDAHNDPLVMDSIVPTLANEFYPKLFPKEDSFQTSSDHEVNRLENRRIEDMLAIVRRASGKEHVVFIIDEVGQYVASRKNLILNLQGLAENLKNIGQGKVWLFATAQQTLTEDDPRAQLNAPELFKLNDRFPIQIDLEAHDIKEICYRRLLGKSAAGETALGELFDKHGQSLRHATKLTDAGSYDSELDKTSFTHLYPFLPAHFEILLHLLGALARSLGGIGLRSAIKVIQDILIERGGAGDIPSVVDRAPGFLATTVTLYDALHQDIRRHRSGYLTAAVEKVAQQFPDDEVALEVAKSVCVLQILESLPVTVDNLAALMHPAVDAPSRRSEVAEKVEAMLANPYVSLGEKGGSLRFLSEKVTEIEQEKALLHVRGNEVKSIFNGALSKDVFKQRPRVLLAGTAQITSGLKIMESGLPRSLGTDETIETVIEFAESGDLDARRKELLEDSRAPTHKHTIFLLAPEAADVEKDVTEIAKCRQIATKYDADLDQEIRDYVRSQRDRADKLETALGHALRKALVTGSFIFRGQATAVTELDSNLLEAAKKHLLGVAQDVYHKHGEAPLRVDTDLAEKFLRTANLDAITQKLDPLGLVDTGGGSAKIKLDTKALVSIKDHLQQVGAVDGKHLLERFSGAPYHWSPDTIRYLVAAMLVGGEIKLRVGGAEITAPGNEAIEALKTNQKFKKNVGVALRDDRPSAASLKRAGDRLTELSGDRVLPLEPNVCKAAVEALAPRQSQAASLAAELRGLDLPGHDRAEALADTVQELVATDGSEAPSRLGGEESPLYNDVLWADAMRKSLQNGLTQTVRDLKECQQAIKSLPASGIPGQLRQDSETDLASLNDYLSKEDFHKHATDLTGGLATLNSKVGDAVKQLCQAQEQFVNEQANELTQMPGWSLLEGEEKQNALAQIEAHKPQAESDIAGLKHLLAQEYDLRATVDAVKGEAATLIAEKQQPPSSAGESTVHRVEISVPTIARSKEELAKLRSELEATEKEVKGHEDFEVRFKLS